MDKVVLTILADFLVNLAAGWVGAGVILPIVSRRAKIKWFLLNVNIGFGIFSLIFAYFFRRNL